MRLAFGHATRLAFGHATRLAFGHATRSLIVTYSYTDSALTEPLRERVSV
ncbi:hypothetical protein [Moorena producens]